MALPLALALLPAAYQGIQGIRQHSLAKRLKESTFVPQELLMNQNLAQQQAFSRRAPGQAFAEEQVRRNAANQISAAQRSFGGDANKIAAVTSAATAGANDANARLAAQGAQFSEAALGRLMNANTAVAGQKRQNRDEFNRAKAELIAAGDQNIFNAISNVATAGIAGSLNRKGKGGTSGTAPGMMSNNPWSTWMWSRNPGSGYYGMSMRPPYGYGYGPTPMN